jgi:hypothetical protein
VKEKIVALQTGLIYINCFLTKQLHPNGPSEAASSHSGSQQMLHLLWNTRLISVLNGASQWPHNSYKDKLRDIIDILSEDQQWNYTERHVALRIV